MGGVACLTHQIRGVAVLLLQRQILLSTGSILIGLVFIFEVLLIFKIGLQS